ncbi:MAG: MerR family transcriptional regulator [Pseudomonadota bacterium]
MPSVKKSAEAFRTISEAADELDVPQHVLRHWEDVFGQIRPMRRAGGRRYYRPVDLDLLRGVRVLLYQEKYTTKGVQKILKENGVKYVGDIGRAAASGQPIDLRKLADSEKAQPDVDRDQSGATSQTTISLPEEIQSASLIGATPTPNELGPALRTKLETLLTRLEKVETALDEAASALDALPRKIDETE